MPDHVYIWGSCGYMGITHPTLLVRRSSEGFNLGHVFLVGQSLLVLQIGKHLKNVKPCKFICIWLYPFFLKYYELCNIVHQDCKIIFSVFLIPGYFLNICFLIMWINGVLISVWICSIWTNNYYKHRTRLLFSSQDSHNSALHCICSITGWNSHKPLESNSIQYRYLHEPTYKIWRARRTN